MATRTQIKDSFYEIVAETSSSTVYPSSDTGGSFVENLVNRVQDTICRKRKWWFLKTKSLFNTAIDTTLNTAITTASTTIVLTSVSTNFPTSGAILINNEDVVNFTGRSGTTLTGVTNIDISHAATATIEPIYPVPTDFSLDPVLFVINTSKNKIRYIQVDADDDGVSSADDAVFEFGRQSNRWSLLTDKSGNEFIHLNNPNNEADAVFQYIKTATTTTSDLDVLTIPDPFALKVVPLEMAKLAMLERGDNPDGLADQIGLDAQTELADMSNYHMRRLQGTRPRIKNMYRSGRPRTRRERLIVS